jgi:hypothetical protein
MLNYRKLAGIIVGALFSTAAAASVDSNTTTQQVWTAGTITELAAQSGPRVGTVSWVRDVDTGTAGLQGAYFVAVPFGTFSTSSLHAFEGQPDKGHGNERVEWADLYTLTTSFVSSLTINWSQLANLPTVTCTAPLRCNGGNTATLGAITLSVNALVNSDISSTANIATSKIAACATGQVILGGASNACGVLPYSALGSVPANFTPAQHGSTHLPNGSDPIATAAPAALGVGQTQSAGTANTLSRSDHTHATPGLATSTSSGFVIQAGANNTVLMSNGSNWFSSQINNNQLSASAAIDVSKLATSGLAKRFVGTFDGTAMSMLQVQYTDLGSLPSTFTATPHAATHVTGTDQLANVTTSTHGLMPSWFGVSSAVPNTSSDGSTMSWTTAPNLGALTVGYEIFGTTPAGSGLARFPNNVASIAFRNAANSGDVSGLYLDASNHIVLGSAAFPSAPIAGDAGKVLTVAGAGSYTLATPSVDWPNISNKPANLHTGTGTADYIPKWTGATTLGDSPMSLQTGGQAFRFGTAGFGTAFTAPMNWHHVGVGTSYSDTTNWITPGVGSNAIAMILTDTSGITFHTAASIGSTARTTTPAAMESISRARISDTGLAVYGAMGATGNVSAGGEVQSTANPSFRSVNGSFGTFWSFDGSSLALRKTASGSPYGGADTSQLPFFWYLPSGDMSFGTGAISITSGTVSIANLQVTGGSPAAGKIAYSDNSTGHIGWKDPQSNITDVGGTRLWNVGFDFAIVGPGTTSKFIACADWSGCANNYYTDPFASTLIEVETFQSYPSSSAAGCRQKFYTAAGYSSNGGGGWWIQNATNENTSERAVLCSGGTTVSVNVTIESAHVIRIDYTYSAPAQSMLTSHVRVLGSGVHS